jgi:hypothetical protein
VIFFEKIISDSLWFLGDDRQLDSLTAAFSLTRFYQRGDQALQLILDGP